MRVRRRRAARGGRQGGADAREGVLLSLRRERSSLRTQIARGSGGAMPSGRERGVEASRRGDDGGADGCRKSAELGGKARQSIAK